MQKLPIVAEIEKLLKRTLHEAPVRAADRLAGLMPYKKDTPKYALSEDGTRLIGLNLAFTELTDAQWNALVALNGFLARDMQALNLSDNKLREFRLPEGMSNLQSLNLDDNALTFPPKEIQKQGNEGMLQYLKGLIVQGTRDVYEVKLLIVGEGETGKTTFWNKLQNPKYPCPLPQDQQPSTIGISIKEGWEFDHPDHPGTKFLVNLWDFGGQEVQYMTHQFFLTRRSFYVLLADGRRESNNFMYWFKIINLLGCDPREKQAMPVLVLLNEKGNPNAKYPYDPEEIKTGFSRLEVIRRQVDFSIMDDRMEGLPALIRDLLAHRLGHLPLEIPAFWDKVRDALYELRKKEDYIRMQEFERICKKSGIHDPANMHALSQLLHDLGVILHFQEDTNLYDFMVLNPQWALNAIYAIMKDQSVAERQGRFDQDMLQTILEKRQYNKQEQALVLNLMLKDSFEVCFRAEEDGRPIMIAPQLLPKDRPKFEWNPGNRVLRYTYQYPFMPKGLVGRLIVRVHELIDSQGGKKVLWEKGVRLSQDKSKALIEELTDVRTGGQIIQISVIGNDDEDRRFLLRNIRRELDHIHKRSFPSLRFEEKIPCSCNSCINSDSPEFYDLSILQQKLNRSKSTIECRKSDEDVFINTLLFGVYGNEASQTRGTNPRKVRIGKGEDLQNILAEMLESAPEDRKNEIIQLQAQLNAIKRVATAGTVEWEQENRAVNKIRESVLDLCDQIDYPKL